MNIKITTLFLFSFILCACQDDNQQNQSTLQKASDQQTASEQPDKENHSAVVAKRKAEDNLSHEYAKLRKRQIQSVKYHLAVQLDSQSTEFTGQTKIEVNLFENNQAPITIDFSGGKVKQVQVNDRQVDWEYNQFFISLAAELFQPGKNQIEIDYSHPYASDGYGLHRFVEKQTNSVYVYTHFEPYKANRFFPHFDQPNLRATYRIQVSTPADWQVITSVIENKVETTENTKLWHFPESANFSSYILPLHAGPYKVWHDKAGDIPLRLFARQSIAPYVNLDEWFTPTKQGFKFFQDYFAIPYPYIKYDQVISPDYNIGAMENVAAVTFNESYIRRGEKTRAQKRSLANTIAHEMAHMWFGNLVTIDWWNGLWLKESFATYMANLFLAEGSDYKEAWDAFYAGTEQWAYQSDEAVTTHPIELPVSSTAEAYTNFDGITYGKGASVLRQLPFYLGEDNFRKGVRNYLKEYANQATTLDDFMQALGKAANMDMNEWQQQWLYQAGVNTIKISYQCEVGKISQMNINQTAPEDWPTLRNQRVQVGLFNIKSNKMTFTKSIPVTYRGAQTAVKEAIGQQCPDVVYPNYQDWGFVKVVLDDKSVKHLKHHINDFAEVKTRLMMWQSLWDAVRDAKLPITEYIDFALANIPAEKDNNLINKVSRSLTATVAYLSYLDQDSNLRKNYLEKVESFLWLQTSQASPKSDQQKTWFKGFVSAVNTNKGLQQILDLLDGQTELTGLTIDQDQRWSLIQKLAEFEFKNYQKILDIETQKDTSDKGLKSALAAKAIIPILDNKKQWLQVLINQPEAYKLSAARNIIWNLFPSSQHQLLEKFSEEILEAIPQLNNSAEQAYVRSFSGLAPSLCRSASVERLAKAKQDFKDFDPSIVKSIKRSHQEDQRCVDILKLVESGG